MRKTLAVLASAGAAVSLTAAPALAAHEGSTYSAQLRELNGSGATGDASLQVSEDGETMTLRVNATGLDLDFAHAMHIHGIYDGDLSDAPDAGTFSSSACPDMSADANGDGVLTVVEGVPAYGEVLVSLTTSGDTSASSGLAVDRFPSGTSITYERTGIPIPSAMKDELGKVHVVVHGTDVDDNGDESNGQGIVSSLDPSLPVDVTAPALCGELAVVASGAVQTGGGGTVQLDRGTDASSVALAALGAGAVVAGSVAVRRRRGSES